MEYVAGNAYTNKTSAFLIIRSVFSNKLASLQCKATDETKGRCAQSVKSVALRVYDSMALYLSFILWSTKFKKMKTKSIHYQ